MLVYVDAALASNLTTLGKILLIVLLVGTAGLLGVAVAATDRFIMHDRIIELDGPRQKYKRRLDLAKELIGQSKRHDWALKIGMVNETDLESPDDTPVPPNTEGQDQSDTSADGITKVHTTVPQKDAGTGVPSKVTM